jgi:hypothetical protein
MLALSGVRCSRYVLTILAYPFRTDSKVLWTIGCVDSEDTMRFSALTGIEAMIETYPLTRAAEAYERMMSGKARFRVVLVP